MKKINTQEVLNMYAVEMLGITKKFGDFCANKDVNLQVKRGEIHCLLGENGAGKTTLMNVLFGLYKPEEGTIRIKGEEVHHHSSRNAFHLGLGMVHQHFMLVDALTVWENVIVGNELGKFAIPKKESIEAVQKLSDQYNFGLDVTAKVSELSVGMKQRVEILKTLYRGANIIILDEPTAVLSPPEVEQLLEILRDMKAEGKTIVFITHKLNETKSVADRVTVLRAGQSVSTVEVAEHEVSDFANMMVGREVNFDMERPEVPVGEVVLSLQGVRLLPNAQNTVSFDIRAGEIVGIAGVEGNGQQQLEEMIMGLIKCREGKIEFLGNDISHWNTKKLCAKGIGYIPSDRHERAILPGFSITDNYLLGTQFSDKYVKNGIINHSKLNEQTDMLMEHYDVRATSPKQNIGSLSGGNQQKMVLSREVDKDADLVIACQPVRGLDIGAIQYIHKVLMSLRAQGKAVLLISAELTDIRQLSDRIAVMYKGEILALKKNEDYSTEAIGLLMAGQRESE